MLLYTLWAKVHGDSLNYHFTHGDSLIFKIAHIDPSIITRNQSTPFCQKDR